MTNETQRRLVYEVAPTADLERIHRAIAARLATGSLGGESPRAAVADPRKISPASDFPLDHVT
jgi:hypothetical protein